LSVVAIALRVYRSPRLAWKSLQHIIRLNKTVRGGEQGQKYYRIGRRFFWSPVVPQWPSRPFVRFVESILDRVEPFRPQSTRLGSVIMAVSSRCPLHCKHCLEANNLGPQEHLTLAELQTILGKFRQIGVVQVVLSGGEPMSRYSDVCQLLAGADDDMEFSMLTSGFGLTAERARCLREAGLSSVQIALDHWDEDRHNSFRGHPEAFRWAREAAANANEAGLLVGFSLCAVEDFVSWENLLRYLELVRCWGGVSVRILEPRAVGRYAGREVQLSATTKELLHKFYEQINSWSQYSHLPRLTYPEYHKKTLGCFGGGNRLVYADSRGEVHPCPFCDTSVGNALTEDLGEMVRVLRSGGCDRGFASSLAAMG
jgi:MoaA/NifB/PqqE/SkfB family radical SAM enzyme